MCTMYDKLLIAGNISSLWVICYLIDQLWYNGSKIIKSLKVREFQPNLTAIFWAFCYRIAAFVVSPKYSQAIRQHKDVEEGRQSSLSADGDSASVPVLASYNISDRDKRQQEVLSSTAGRAGRDRERGTKNRNGD